MDDVASGTTPAAYTALQSLGMGTGNIFGYRDAFAMIGRKGATPGTVTQVHGKYQNGGIANLVACMKCSIQCFSCLEERNEFVALEGIFSQGYVEITPVTTSTDYLGNSGTVFRNDIFHISKYTYGKKVDIAYLGKIRFGTYNIYS